ncbi:MAG: RHS repeat-associated core domain-containing protein [Planctomycetota bacterium]
MSLVLGVATLSCVVASALSPFAIHDYKNRLVGVTEKSTGTPIATYVYYSDNRRAQKTVFATGETTTFFYDGWQVCEETGASNATYVWNPVYVDELCRMDRDGGQFYAHQNARADVVAVSDATGAVVEQRFFDDYGQVFDTAKQGTTLSAVGNPYGFQGRRLDPETGLYYFRNRYYSPSEGRFIQRDPVWDAANVGGQYSFAGSSPLSGADPDGLRRRGGYWRNFWASRIRTFRRQQQMEAQHRYFEAIVPQHRVRQEAEEAARWENFRRQESNYHELLSRFGERNQQGDKRLPQWVLDMAKKSGRLPTPEEAAAHRQSESESCPPTPGSGGQGQGPPPPPAPPGSPSPFRDGPLSPRQIKDAIRDLREGRDVDVNDIRAARQILDALPELRPHVTSGKVLTVPAGEGTRSNDLFERVWEQPPGTYRGDLRNPHTPSGGPIHETVVGPHRDNPHYNIRFSNPKSKRVAIVIRPR